MANINVAFSLRQSEEDIVFEKLHCIGSGYPHISATIGQLWGTRDLSAYLNQLIIKDRENRAGFPADVMTALLSLSAEHCRIFGFEAESKGDDFWGPVLRSVYH